MIGLFSRSIFPRKGASAVVTEELARCFSRDEMVIVGGRKIFEEPIIRSDADVEVLSLGSEINLSGRGDRFFEPLRWLLFPIHLVRAIGFCRRNRCTSIVATFPDELFLFLGLMVARRLQLPFYAYLHNTLVENRTGLRLKVAKYIQKNVFREAESVFVISEGLERFYRQEYPWVIFKILPHVFANYPDIKTSGNILRSSEIKSVALCGNFNQTNIDATRRVIEALHSTSNYQITLYTPVPPFLLRLRGIDTSKLYRIDYVSEHDFMKRLNEADLLVLTHGLQGGLSDIEYRTIFPTRTVSLMLAQRPLLVHAPKNSFLVEYIQERGCGLVVDSPNEQAIIAAAQSLTSDESLACQVTERAAEATKMFYGPVVKAQLLAGVQ